MKNQSIKLKQIQSALLLFLASIVWGAAFVVQSVAGESLGTFTFNGIRFIIGGLCILPIVYKERTYAFKDTISDELGIIQKFHSTTLNIPRNKMLGGFICGMALFLASTFQQAGIVAGAQAGEAGFLTAFYIILVPILGIFIGKKCPGQIWIAVVIALTGLYFLCFTPGNFSLFNLSLPNFLLLSCALLYAVQILTVDHYAPIMSPVGLSCVQFFVCGFASLICGIIFEFIPDPVSTIHALLSLRSWILILYMGIFSSAIGYTLQAVGQRNLNPTIASLIMSMESVFSSVFGWLILRQTMSIRELAGCGLIFSSIILAQIPINFKKGHNNTDIIKSIK